MGAWRRRRDNDAGMGCRERSRPRCRGRPGRPGSMARESPQRRSCALRTARRTIARPDEAVLWGSQAPSPSADAEADAAPTQVIDPWRGVVFSYDQPQVAASEVVETPPQPDPTCRGSPRRMPPPPSRWPRRSMGRPSPTRRSARSTTAAGSRDRRSRPEPPGPSRSRSGRTKPRQRRRSRPTLTAGIRVPDEQPTLVEDSYGRCGRWRRTALHRSLRDHWVGSQQSARSLAMRRTTTRDPGERR